MLQVGAKGIEEEKKKKKMMMMMMMMILGSSSLDKRPKLRKLDMRFGTWNVRSLYRAGSLITVAKEISKYKLDLVGVQVRWDRGGTEPALLCEVTGGCRKCIMRSFITSALLQV
jgi:hypothetical protein